MTLAPRPASPETYVPSRNRSAPLELWSHCTRPDRRLVDLIADQAASSRLRRISPTPGIALRTGGSTPAPDGAVSSHDASTDHATERPAHVATPVSARTPGLVPVLLHSHSGPSSVRSQHGRVDQQEAGTVQVTPQTGVGDRVDVGPGDPGARGQPTGPQRLDDLHELEDLGQARRGQHPCGVVAQQLRPGAGVERQHAPRHRGQVARDQQARERVTVLPQARTPKSSAPLSQQTARSQSSPRSRRARLSSWWA